MVRYNQLMSHLHSCRNMENKKNIGAVTEFWGHATLYTRFLLHAYGDIKPQRFKDYD